MTQPTPEPSPTPAEPAAPEPPAQAEPDWKAEARKWEQRAKDNKAAADKLAEIEAANKTAEQKAAEAQAAAEKRATDAETQLLRFEVARDKGVPAEAVDLLTGATREEIEARADVVLKLIEDGAKPRKPQPDPAQGRSPAAAGLTTAQQFAAAIEGQLTT